MTTKRTLLAAAMMFSACDTSKPERPPPSMRVSRPAASPPPIAVAPMVVDAGRPVVEPPVDALALSTLTPGVDHLSRAKQRLDEGDVKAAYIEARRALFGHADDEETLEWVAKLARRTGDSARAAEAWGRLATLRPDDTLPCLQQARALYVMRDHAGMAMAAREAISRDEESVEGYHLTGLAQLSMGELAGAITSFERTIKLAPGHGYALNNLGLAYLRASKNAEAVVTLEQAAALLPAISYVQNNFGVALERVGRRDDAKIAYQHAMDLSPKYVKARINAARVAQISVPLDAAPEAEPNTENVEAAQPHPLPAP